MSNEEKDTSPGYSGSANKRTPEKDRNKMSSRSRRPVDETTPLIQFLHKGRHDAVIHTSQLENRRIRLMIELFFLCFLVLVSLPIVFDFENLFARSGRSEAFSEDLPLEGAGVRVSEGSPTFPSYLSYAAHGPIDVTFDKRSFMLNGNRVLFVGGSLHPARATPETWKVALDEAVRHGLNMITVYVFWNAHQPFPDSEMDWSLPNGGGRDICGKHGDSKKDLICNWNLASSIREAATRGLFVHIRIGPYTCAEYNYGGIPEWVPLHHPDMEMRRQNQLWMQVMETYVEETVGYLTEYQLWAYQGGPIVMGQIENELQPESETDAVFMDGQGDEDNQEARQLGETPSMQDHAEWCGKLAARVEPNVVWTMCNGLSASNTINTCNGMECVSFIESNGQSGRIQVDHPAMWTELEGGFQIWGEGPKKPTGYFWGRTARSYAREALRWFARGGSHINYYMWWGSYNRGRTAGAGIANIYANDAPICSSGERRQPKFDHLRSLHGLLADIAPTLINAPSALHKEEPVEHRDENGDWKTDPKQRMFVYRVDSDSDHQEVIFVENDANEVVDVRVPVRNKSGMKMLRVYPTSVVVIVNGSNMYDSATVSDAAMSYERHTKESPVQLLSMHSWPEMVDVNVDDPRVVVSDTPIEQTDLMMGSGLLSDYAWYETSFTLEDSLQNASISIDTQRANAMVVFIDKAFMGDVNTHQPAQGNITLSMDIGELSKGNHRLFILSESLGYSNIIGTWGASTKAKTKGITGAVVLSGESSSSASGRWNQNLVDGRSWMSFAGLRVPEGSNQGSLRKLSGGAPRSETTVRQLLSLPPCSWSKATFDTPTIYQESLFLDIAIGRGRIWLNGYDLGRFWNISRGDESPEPTQRYYLLPKEFLFNTGKLNELVIFNSLGGNPSSMRLVLSWVESSDTPNFKDEVDFPSSCLI